MKSLVFLLLGLVACVFSAPGQDVVHFEQLRPAVPLGNLLQELTNLRLNSLVTLVKAAGLSEAVMDNTLTLFAPTDEAIDRLPKHVQEYLMKNKTALQELLKYHAVSGTVMSHDIKNEQLAPSVDPHMDNIRLNIYMEASNSRVDAEGCRVILADHGATNGVIHVIDRVMFPIPMHNIAAFLMHDVHYFSSLLTALKAADMTSMFEGEGPFTLFAPDDEAFMKLPAGTLDALLKDKTKLKAVLSYHIVAGTYFANGLPRTLKTAQGSTVSVKMDRDRIMVNRGTVNFPDRKVTNGVIHIIDEVLMPQMETYAAAGNVVDVAKQLRLNTLLKLADAAGLTQMAEENTLTLMGPTDQAFARLPPPVMEALMKNMTALTEVLEFHVIPDAVVMSSDLQNEELASSADMMMDNVRFNIYKDPRGKSVVTSDGARVIKADQKASNGIIHVIDRVMYPIPTDNLMQILTRDQRYFSTLIDAGKAAGLLDMLEDSGPYTLFAPDDAAFKKLPAGALDALLKDKTKLQGVLEYHVLTQTVYSEGLFDGQSFSTAQGSSVRIKRTAGTLMVQNAKVKYMDRSASNGVMHIIDQVMMPPSW